LGAPPPSKGRWSNDPWGRPLRPRGLDPTTLGGAPSVQEVLVQRPLGAPPPSKRSWSNGRWRCYLRGILLQRPLDQRPLDGGGAPKGRWTNDPWTEWGLS
jgi:hypothetical protein